MSDLSNLSYRWDVWIDEDKVYLLNPKGSWVELSPGAEQRLRAACALLAPYKKIDTQYQYLFHPEELLAIVGGKDKLEEIYAAT